MKNSLFKYELLNNRIFILKPLLLMMWAVAAFSCSRNENNTISYFKDFRVERVELHFPEWKKDEYINYKFSDANNELIVFNKSGYDFRILEYPLWNEIKRFSLDTLSSFKNIRNADLYGNLLLLMGQDHKLAFLDLETRQLQEINADSSIDSKGLRMWAQYDFASVYESPEVFVPIYNYRHNRFFFDTQDLTHFFSSPLELRYNVNTGEHEVFGRYPDSYRDSTLRFYDFLPQRRRLNGRSLYSFGFEDSLYAYNDRTDQEQTVERKSILCSRDLITLDKTRLGDFVYLWDYDFINDHYTDLIADPYRNLIYSVFVPGVDPPKQRRLRDRDVAFTVMIFNSDLEFQKEVYFPPGEYDYRFHFVTPDGLCLQTVASEGKATRVFDVFDFTLEGEPMERLPEDLSLARVLPSLGSYLRDGLGVAKELDSVLVISGLGCSGCLESMMIEAEAKDVDLDGYAYVATRDAANIQTISDFLSRHSHAYVDSIGDLGDYRAIGDFLTLVVLDGDSAVEVDDKFEF